MDISIFDKDYDVRKDDLITLVYHLKFTDRTPVLIINHTTKEFYNYECLHIKGNHKSNDLLEFKKRGNKFRMSHRKVLDIDNYDIYENLPKLNFVNINFLWLP